MERPSLNHWLPQGHKSPALLPQLGTVLKYHPVIRPCQVTKVSKESFSSAQFSRSVVSDSVTPWTAACPASLSITNSWSLLKLMSIESVMPSNHLILCYPLLLLPSIFPSIRVFSNVSVLHIRWPKYWSFSWKLYHKPNSLPVSSHFHPILSSGANPKSPL